MTMTEPSPLPTDSKVTIAVLPENNATQNQWPYHIPSTIDSDFLHILPAAEQLRWGWQAATNQIALVCNNPRLLLLQCHSSCCWKMSCWLPDPVSPTGQLPWWQQWNPAPPWSPTIVWLHCHACSANKGFAHHQCELCGKVSLPVDACSHPTQILLPSYPTCTPTNPAHIPTITLLQPQPKLHLVAILPPPQFPLTSLHSCTPIPLAPVSNTPIPVCIPAKPPKPSVICWHGKQTPFWTKDNLHLPNCNSFTIAPFINQYQCASSLHN